MNTIEYVVTIDRPFSHMVHVEATFRSLSDRSSIDLELPTWTPGSYKIRDYVKHVMNVRATDASGTSVKVTKSSKSVWTVDAPDDAVTVHYDVYCHNEGVLSPRESHIDDQMALLHFPTLLMYWAERRDLPLKLDVQVPKGWRIYSSLLDPDTAHVLESASLKVPCIDYLFDTPLMAGHLPTYRFDVEEIPHYITVNESLEDVGIHEDRFLEVVKQIVEANRRNFDHFPYDRYRFFLLFSTQRGGGLEHHNSSVNVVARDQALLPPTPPPYDHPDTVALLGLLAHEHFHSWNVKEFGPEPLFRPDFLKEIDTRQLWTVEGFANYFDERALLEGQLITETTYLKDLCASINRYEATPGRNHDCLLECGANAWFKHYQPDENTVNTAISYYLGGALTAGMLDITMLDVTDGNVGLSHLLRHLSEHCRYDKDPNDGPPGYPLHYFEKAVCELTHHDLSDFFDRYVRGAESLPFDRMLPKVGLKVVREKTEDLSLGLRFKRGTDKLIISQVIADTCGWRGGLAPGDVIIAVDKREVHQATFQGLLRQLLDIRREVLTVDFFRNGRLRNLQIPLASIDIIHPVRQIVFDESADCRHLHLRNLWLCLHDANLEMF